MITISQRINDSTYMETSVKLTILNGQNEKSNAKESIKKENNSKKEASDNETKVKIGNLNGSLDSPDGFSGTSCLLTYHESIIFDYAQVSEEHNI